MDKKGDDVMRRIKLLAMVLSLGMILSGFAGCAGSASAPTTEEPTTTTTAAPTSTPTPTPEPTSTPTPTPLVEEWVTDEKLIGTWTYDSGGGVVISYTFNEDNTGLLLNSYPVVDWQTKEESFKTTETEIKYSVIGEGMIRIITGEDRYIDYEYKFVKQGLQLEDSDHYSKNVYKKS